MEMTRRYVMLALLLPILALGSSRSAAAQSAVADGDASAAGEPVGADDAGSDRGRTLSIEELVVTARKRAENLQDTPVAITALARRDLKDYNIRRIQDISTQVPNLAFDASADSSVASRINLRAVGNGDSIPTDDPGVGVFLDGVYLARAQSSLLAVVDVERVEVVRGPQGTIFGKNTIGGAINIIPVKPDLVERGGEAEIRLGSYDMFDSRVSLNVPIIPEAAAARFSVATSTRDGFVTNKLGSDLDDEKLLSVRAQLRVVPTDDLEINLSADHALEDRKPQAFKCKVVNPFPAGTTALTRPDLAATGTRFRSAPANAGLAQQLGVTSPLQQATNLLTGANPFLDACAEDSLRDTRTVASDLSFQEDDLRTLGAASTVAWDLGGALTLKSISAWRRQELDSARDFDATGFNLVPINVIDAGRYQQDQISQEFQLLGNAIDGRLTYVLGVFALTEKTHNRGYVSLALGQSFLVLAPTPTGFASVTPSLLSTRLSARNSTYAAFGQGTYSLTRKLRATLGLRVTKERKQLRRDDQCQSAGFLCPATGTVLFGFEGATRSSDLSPSATLDYSIGQTANVYASFTRGFKSGGFNGRADSPALTDEIDDERLTTYEVGFKSMLWDNRLRLAGAVFDSIYEDIQLSANRSNPLSGANQTFVTNAGEARIRGAELEMRAILLPGLELSSALGVTHARYTDFDVPPLGPNDSQLADDPEDRQLPNTPAYTMNFALSYGFDVGQLGNLRARADWTHVGRSGTDTVDTPELRKGKHGELDAQLIWAWPDGTTELVLFGDNLFDREYLTNGINLGTSFGHALRVYNEPRTYGMELRRRF
jgi:iron complex outermembrane recepter protein